MHEIVNLLSNKLNLILPELVELLPYLYILCLLLLNEVIKLMHFLISSKEVLLRMLFLVTEVKGREFAITSIAAQDRKVPCIGIIVECQGLV